MNSSFSTLTRCRLALLACTVLVWSSACDGLNQDDRVENTERVQSSLTGGKLVRVNCGSTVAVGAFAADSGSSGGATITRANTIDLTGVSNPAPAAVYQSQRFGNPPMSYTFSGFAAGALNDIRLHFADTHYTTTGQRQFNVSINGVQVLSTFDVVAAAGAGNKAVVRKFSAAADASGSYAIGFTAIANKDYPTISAIEILPPRGAWSRMAHAFPESFGNGQQLQVLTDGSILLGNGNNGTRWFRLAPDANGLYENGVWTRVASSHFARSFYPSTMLKNGQYLIAGGEYVVGTSQATGEIYDPVNDEWTQIKDMDVPIADTAASVTPDGRFYCSSAAGPQTFMYTPGTNTWAQAADIGTGGSGDEKGWTLLQNGNILDVWTIGSVFNVGSGAWSATQPLPVDPDPNRAWLVSSWGGEIGPASLLYSGKVLAFGSATQPQPNSMGGPVVIQAHTAIYDPTTNAWASGPDAPDGLQWGDTSANVMINGHVLNATATGISASGGTSSIWELDPDGATFTKVADNNGLEPNSPRNLQLPIFLQLPNGQVLVTDGNDLTFSLYTPVGGQSSVSTAWMPSLTSVSAPSSGDFTLTGTQLNGLTTGATFGDDRNSGTNFPIVWLTDNSTPAHVFYARTHDFSQMAPLRGTSSTCQFTLPTNIPNGSYQVHVSASGVASSNTLPLTVSGTHVTSISGPNNLQPNASAPWTVAISSAAPSGGTLINLHSDDPTVASLPTTVTVPSGALSITFAVTGKGFGKTHLTAVTATTNSQFKPASASYGLTVDAIFQTAGVFAPPSSLAIYTPATQATWTVNISNPAPTGGAVVNLLSDSPLGAAFVPATVLVQAGSTSATFAVNRGSWLGGETNITASMLNSSKSNPITTYNATGIPVLSLME